MQQTATKSTPVKPLATLRMEDLTKKLSACKGTVYGLLKDETCGFPAGFSYGGRGVYYLEHEVDAWLLRQQVQNPARPTLPQ